MGKPTRYRLRVSNQPSTEPQGVGYVTERADEQSADWMICATKEPFTANSPSTSLERKPFGIATWQHKDEKEKPLSLADGGFSNH